MPEEAFAEGDRVEAIKSFGFLRRVVKGSRGTVISAGKDQPLKVEFDEFSVDMVNRTTAAGPTTLVVDVRPDRIVRVRKGAAT
jgi:hypothetical protein